MIIYRYTRLDCFFASSVLAEKSDTELYNLLYHLGAFLKNIDLTTYESRNKEELALISALLERENVMRLA
jgi:hypothetical protein